MFEIQQKKDKPQADNNNQPWTDEKVNKEIEIYRKSTIDPRAFVILDDCLYDQTWTRDKLMRLLFMNGRH